MRKGQIPHFTGKKTRDLKDPGALSTMYLFYQYLTCVLSKKWLGCREKTSKICEF